MNEQVLVLDRYITSLEDKVVKLESIIQEKERRIEVLTQIESERTDQIVRQNIEIQRLRDLLSDARNEQ